MAVGRTGTRNCRTAETGDSGRSERAEKCARSLRVTPCRAARSQNRTLGRVPVESCSQRAEGCGRRYGPEQSRVTATENSVRVENLSLSLTIRIRPSHVASEPQLWCARHL